MVASLNGFSFFFFFSTFNAWIPWIVGLSRARGKFGLEEFRVQLERGSDTKLGKVSRGAFPSDILGILKFNERKKETVSLFFPKRFENLSSFFFLMYFRTFQFRSFMNNFLVSLCIFNTHIAKPGSIPNFYPQKMHACHLIKLNKNSNIFLKKKKSNFS